MLTTNETPAMELSQPAYEIIQASSGKRFANYLIDMIFFYMIIVFWAVIAAIVWPSVIESIDDNDNVFGTFSERLVGLIAYAIVMSLIEAIFRGKSIGKLITGTKAINEDGSDISFAKAFARGFVRAVPFNALSAFGHPSFPWHDKWTNTYVIDEKATKAHNEALHNATRGQML